VGFWQLLDGGGSDAVVVNSCTGKWFGTSNHAFVPE